MAAFSSLVEGGNWELQLPLEVHGVTISEQALGHPPTTAPLTSARTLQLTTPYLRGPDVEKLQQQLYAKFGLGLRPDGVYGPFTNKLVNRWQKEQRIDEQGAGENTRKSLGL